MATIKRVPGDPPFVIDRRLPRGLFERMIGARSFVADGDRPMEFLTHDAAEEYLRGEADEEYLSHYEWTIEPLEGVE